jgi:hypothetical protein
MHTRHAQAHTSHTHTHTHNTTHHAQHALHKGKNLRAKEGNPFKLSFFEVGVAISAKHISSVLKGKSSSTVELQIGGAAASELVWWSRSPPKHALNFSFHLLFLVARLHDIHCGIVFFFERNGKRLAVIFIRRKKEAQETSK